MKTHEEKVNIFFSHGSNLRALQEGGFLSFGYWTKKEQNYHQAAEDLLELFLSKETVLNRGIILNVACGYGSETFIINDKLNPDRIIAIDITSDHIEYAKKIAHERNLTHKVIFDKQDACILPFQPDYFAYVMGIEGPSQFNTREQFLKRAYDILEPGGVLLLTDIIVHKDIAKKNWLNRRIRKIISKHWYMPESNWMNNDRYNQMLVDIGFKVDFIKNIGAYVYPGFAKFNTKWTSILNAIHVRGFRIGLGLTIISWLLGIASKRNMIDYAHIRAKK
jgi:demethylmenaquinone methyltransferase/2-methoxy-6-polyprenyl-1,4-benzoquinol methylase